MSKFTALSLSILATVIIAFIVPARVMYEVPVDDGCYSLALSDDNSRCQTKTESILTWGWARKYAIAKNDYEMVQGLKRSDVVLGLTFSGLIGSLVFLFLAKKKNKS